MIPAALGQDSKLILYWILPTRSGDPALSLGEGSSDEGTLLKINVHIASACFSNGETLVAASML